MLAVFAALLAAVAIVQTLAGWALTARFARGQRRGPTGRPPVTILKPLYGDEPLLEAALSTVCTLGYPEYQVVFGVSSADDTAIPVIRRLESRFPARDLTLVVNPTGHGPNLKVGNLMNMLPAARHEILVIADSDLHVRPDYLDQLVAALEQPATGLVTTLYAGFPASSRLPALLGAQQITHTFLPGALLSRALGRQDCLGATMALRRAMLRRIGGFEALVTHLADDNALGRLVQATGLAVRLAETVPLTTVPEDTFRALFRHELRWARTIRALVPGRFAASCLQYPIFWGLVVLVLAPAWGCVVLSAAWLARIASGQGVNKALSRLGVAAATPVPIWLLPLRELMSVGVMVASFTGLRVDWRGHTMTADGPAQPQETSAP